MEGVHLDPRRDYRRLAAQPGETAFGVVVETTDLWVVCPRDLSEDVAAVVRELRAGLSAYIGLHPLFRESFEPVALLPQAPGIARVMAEAAARFGVGPMAAVAGAFAQAVAEAFPKEKVMLVENGGDVYLRSNRPRVAGLLAEPVSGASLGVRLSGKDFPVSLCASSARIGPSISLGKADLVTVRAREGAVADAAATALANLVRGPEDLQRMLRAAQNWRRAGVEGVFAQCARKVAVWGKMDLVALT